MQHNDEPDVITSEDESLNVPRIPGPTRDDFRQLFLDDTPLLDVRAPIEFSKGAFPQSINYPLMTDEERHQVGIQYKEAGQQHAIALGAELVTANLRQQRVARWKGFARQHPNGALYCFRGGLRSRISQQWLKEAGLEIPLIEGGYKAMRSYLIHALEALCESLPLVLIGGRTGNGKTLLLQKLCNTVDLEALANHRGSSFGNLVSKQPTNIDFENAVSIEMIKLDEAGAQKMYLEDEARLIGRVCLPEALRLAMQRSPIVILKCDMHSRIRNCHEDYVTDLLARYVAMHGEVGGFSAFRDHHRYSLERIQKRFGGENYSQARTMLNTALDQHEHHADTSGYASFIELLLRDYYDPMYDYQLSKKQQRVIFTGTAAEIVNWVEAA